MRGDLFQGHSGGLPSPAQRSDCTARCRSENVLGLLCHGNDVTEPQPRDEHQICESGSKAFSSPPTWSASRGCRSCLAKRPSFTDHHVTRENTRLTTMEKRLTRLSDQLTTFMAFYPRTPAAASSRLSTMDNQLTSTPKKHVVPFRSSSRAPLPPREKLKATPARVASPDATPASATAVAAKPPSSATQPSSSSPSALMPTSQSPFHEPWKFIASDEVYYKFTYRIPCEANPCRYVHGIVPLGYYEDASTRTQPAARTFTVAGFTPQGSGPSEMEVLEYVSTALSTRVHTNFQPQKRKNHLHATFWKTSASMTMQHSRLDRRSAEATPCRVVVSINLR